MSKILVIDDDAGMRSVCRAALTSFGHQVVDAGDARRGLALVDSERPDLVLLDWLMPDSDGMDTLRAIKVRCDVPVIMMTGLSSAPDVWLATSNGADGYITKPFKVADLVTLADRMVVGEAKALAYC
jgi:DNA-binding response OmpR family regulator